MPELTKTYQLKITVEQFLNSCSDTELKEIDLLLGGYLNPPALDNKELCINVGELLKKRVFISEIQAYTNPIEFQNYADILLRVFPELRKVLIDFLKAGFSLAEALEALDVINEMADNTTVSPDEVLELMKYFSRLEKIRLQSLVKKPQLGNQKNEES